MYCAGYGTCVEAGGRLIMEAIMEIFPPVNSRNWTQVIRFGGEHLYPLNHLVGSPSAFWNTQCTIACKQPIQWHSTNCPFKSNFIPAAQDLALFCRPSPLLAATLQHSASLFWDQSRVLYEREHIWLISCIWHLPCHIGTPVQATLPQVAGFTLLRHGGFSVVHGPYFQCHPSVGGIISITFGYFCLLVVVSRAQLTQECRCLLDTSCHAETLGGVEGAFWLFNTNSSIRCHSVFFQHCSI